MPYNTRRKSLSLPMLGIHVPSSSRVHANRSPPSNDSHTQPPSKKLKRAHESTPSVTTSTSPSATSSPSKRPKSAPRVDTPPPSPGASTSSSAQKIDTEGIKDDIVVAVIEQLEKTGNKPHLVKELANVLLHSIPAVESSSNPAAIISSRLTTFLRRPWTALARCPVGKELVGTHPKRTYFFLTTCPHTGIPDPETLNHSHVKQVARVISPSLSGGSSSHEPSHDQTSETSDMERKRCALSPSPELDFSCPDLDPDNDVDNFSPPRTPGSFTGRASVSLSRASSRPSSQSATRGVSLERDEQDFTETAGRVWRQSSRSEATGSSLSREVTSAIVGSPQTMSRSSSEGGVSVKKEESDAQPRPDEMEDLQAACATAKESAEDEERRNSEAAALLFGPATAQITSPDQQPFGAAFKESVDGALESKGAVKKDLKVDLMDLDVEAKLYEDAVWSELKSPENVNVDELDEMFGEY